MFPLWILGISLPMRSQLSLLLVKISYLLFKRMILSLESAHLRQLERSYSKAKSALGQFNFLFL